jgi:hypothetical protein
LREYITSRNFREVNPNDIREYPEDYYDRVTKLCNLLRSHDLDPANRELYLFKLEKVINRRLEVLKSDRLSKIG